ncbi:hypothetical protein M378DRAFT_163653 [Amanita muscaria Koide BX008]|uniref:Uncharacterized protein n=1 Tax=Amanita muscaria (strain Koide BX008) TaxID=946122 RepID=A0A0C2SLV4_AMAMK|nr:hypothetical protein M378DRAFT_163653 [Amanita muscaria Koide BX008]
MQRANQSKINIAIAGVGLEGLTELIDQLLSIPPRFFCRACDKFLENFVPSVWFNRRSIGARLLRRVNQLISLRFYYFLIDHLTEGNIQSTESLA